MRSTGANTIPLGTRRVKTETDADTAGSDHSSRRRSPSRSEDRSRRRSRSGDRKRRHDEHNSSQVKSEATESPVVTPSTRKRKSRWGSEKAFVPGMPTMLPQDLSEEQQNAYLIQLQIEDASRRLRTGDLFASDPSQRSPSPEPVYDSHGKRLNTREVRTRSKLEKLRHERIQEMLKINPHFKPPADYKAPMVRLHDKVWIPQEEYPHINFVGLLIGPRGNTLKALERDTLAKIIIRGKGSVKESKINRPDRQPMPGEDEPLHAYITAADTNIIAGAAAKIKEILEQAIEAPDNYNDMRKVQLRELAVLNGTLRPEEVMGGQRCNNCGDNQHKTWECPNAANVTASIVCTACGGAGHISKDCRNPRPGYEAGGGSQLDDEYSAFMNELEGKSGGGGGGRPFGGGGPAGGSVFSRGGARSQPIMRVNLAEKMNLSGHKPQSLMDMPYNKGPSGPPAPMSLGYGYGNEQQSGPQQPPWGWPPGFMPPPPPGSETEGGYPMMAGYMAPPPPPPVHNPYQPTTSAPSGMDLTSLLAPPPPPE